MPDDAQVVIPHPLLMRAGERGAWQRVFSDYRIIQPSSSSRARCSPHPQGGQVVTAEHGEGQRDVLTFSEIVLDPIPAKAT